MQTLPRAGRIPRWQRRRVRAVHIPQSAVRDLGRIPACAAQGQPGAHARCRGLCHKLLHPGPLRSCSLDLELQTSRPHPHPTPAPAGSSQSSPPPPSTPAPGFPGASESKGPPRPPAPRDGKPCIPLSLLLRPVTLRSPRAAAEGCSFPVGAASRGKRQVDAPTARVRGPAAPTRV